jgi:hypothetical protein
MNQSLKAITWNFKIMGITNYATMEKKLQKAMTANLDLLATVKNIDGDDVRYMFCEDPEIMITIGNYKTVIENIMKKI